MNIKIALAGNPNSGKTTLFNALTGSNQFVGNWSGVTVEKKEGKLKVNTEVTVTDLPGVYSLSPYSPEEKVTRDYLLNASPDVILNIVDGTNLERNLYLTTQLSEVGIPLVIAVNMADIVRKNGDEIDTGKLSECFGCKAVEISALKETGIDKLITEVINAAKSKPLPKYCRFSSSVEKTLTQISKAVTLSVPENKKRWNLIKLFERDEQAVAKLNLSVHEVDETERAVKRAEAMLDNDSQSIIADERYKAAERIISQCYRKNDEAGESVSEKIDRIVTNRYIALPLFALIMFFVYFVAVSSIGKQATEFMDGVFGDGFSAFGRNFNSIPNILTAFLDKVGCAQLVKSLIIDGILGGVGSVLSFVPQMLMLFFFLSFLEECGYMSRIAFMMDKIFRHFGMSGKSFIPLLIGTGCSVPGIMASGTIENDSERRMTVITTSFIPCSAKIPLISMISSTLFSGSVIVPLSAYFIGLVSVAVSGIMLKKTRLFSNDESPFVMELPRYRLPTPKNLFRSTWERGAAFIKKAGTIILLASIIVWLGSHFGYNGEKFALFTDLPLENSLIGTTGRAISFAFYPLGFSNAKAAISTLMGLLAKEETVGVFGVLEFEGMDKLSGYSFMIFNLLCAPCVAAMGAVKREMGSLKWTFFALGYQTVFAYGVSLCIYQIGSVFSGNASVIGIVSAFAFIFIIASMLIRDGKRGRRIEVIRMRGRRCMIV